jgi:hypothetical protein
MENQGQRIKFLLLYRSGVSLESEPMTALDTIGK